MTDAQKEKPQGKYEARRNSSGGPHQLFYTEGNGYLVALFDPRYSDTATAWSDCETACALLNTKPAPVEGVQELKEILKEWRFSSCGSLLYNMYPQYKERVDDCRNLLEKLGVKFDD